MYQNWLLHVVSFTTSGEDFDEDWLGLGVGSQVSSSGIAVPSQPQDSAVDIRDALKSHFTT